VGKLIYRDGSAFVALWVKEQEALLLEDKVEQVMTHIKRFEERYARTVVPPTGGSNAGK
jgi:hypothetical protein